MFNIIIKFNMILLIINIITIRIANVEAKYHIKEQAIIVVC